MKPALIVHGGAGPLPAVEREAVRVGCLEALQAGWSILQAGGTALDAVGAAVVVLEDNPIFNAGTGCVLTADGSVEMDASLMDGNQRRAGAVALVRCVRHPILLARAVMEDGAHVLLAGAGAERFAVERGLATCAPETMIAAAQRTRPAAQATVAGTVGAVAVDVGGHVAAATSTGGRAGKRAGRIGDSAIVGAGTYADDTAGGASATGNGDAILRVSLAHAVVEGLRGGATPDVVARAQIDLLAHVTSADGGVIVADVLGRIGWAFNTPYMSFAWRSASQIDPQVHA